MRINVIETLPKDTQELIADLTERRQHSDTMKFTKEDAGQLAAWEQYLAEIEHVELGELRMFQSELRGNR